MERERKICGLRTPSARLMSSVESGSATSKEA